MSNKVTITLGCDPELALISGSKYIPACGLIGGTKEKPLIIHPNGTAIQEDGVMVEFNTPTAANPNDFWDTVQDSLRLVREFVYSKNNNFALGQIDSVQFTKEQLASEQAQTLGCDPDLLAHQRGQQRTPPTIAQLGNYRYAGGHLHIGYPNKGDSTGQIPGWVMVQFIEAGGYFPSMNNDPQGGRRRFYGLAGLYREKPYGIEYRTPSSFWLAQRSSSVNFLDNVWRIARWVCKNTTKAMSLWEELDFDGINASITSGRMDVELMQQTWDLFIKYGAVAR